MTSRGLEIPKALRGLARGSNLEKNKRYDQILHYAQFPENFINKGGVLDFYIDAAHIAEMFPGGLTKQKFTYQISHHLPLWMQIQTDIDGFQLEQILEDKRCPVGQAGQPQKQFLATPNPMGGRLLSFPNPLCARRSTASLGQPCHSNSSTKMRSARACAASCRPSPPWCDARIASYNPWASRYCWVTGTGGSLASALPCCVLGKARVK